MTTDANTLFRGNSLTTKVVDEFMKKVGMAYLQRTLQSIIDEVSIHWFTAQSNASNYCVTFHNSQNKYFNLFVGLHKNVSSVHFV